MHKIGVFVAMCAMADAMVPPKKREEGERVVPPLEKKRELSKVRSPTSRAAQIPSCGARKQEFGRLLQDLGYRSWEERPGCHSYHNFGSGILPSVVAPPGLELDDLLCLKVSADSVDGLWAPWHNACYKMEGDECPSDAAVCKFDEAALQGQLCHCTHYKNGAQPSGHDQHMCMTTFNLERASNLDPRAHAVHEGFLPPYFYAGAPTGEVPGCTDVVAENYDGAATWDDGSCEYENDVYYKPPPAHAVRICEAPKHGYEEIFGQRIPTCKHPAMACVEPALPPCKHHLPIDVPDGFFREGQGQHPLPDVHMDICAGVETIGAGAFSETDLESIVLPNTVKAIWDAAFTETKLKKVHIPDSVEFIRNQAFFELADLTEVTFGPASSLTYIGEDAFALTGGLTQINLPSGLKYIGNGAFAETGLTHIKLPSGLEHIGNDAFVTTQMSKPGDPIVIPASVTYIGQNAFEDIGDFVGNDCLGTPATDVTGYCEPEP